MTRQHKLWVTFWLAVKQALHIVISEWMPAGLPSRIL